jgi:hypothetical protein
MNLLISMVHFIFLMTSQDSLAAVDTTGVSYKVGLYIGGFLPFVGFLVIFILIIRNRYRFKSKE